MTFIKQWFRITDVIQTEAGSIPVWEFLGYSSARECREAVNDARNKGLIRVGVHAKKLPPGQKIWLIHLERWAALGDRKAV